MKTEYLAITMLATLLMVGCKQKPAEPQATEIVFAGFTDTVELELAPAKKAPEGESYFDQKARSKKPAASATTTVKEPSTTGTTAKATSSSKTAETIYVEADDSHGRVWGHVTMKGDRGTGTIHDEGENTWAVTVTRHGNELYAVDQNSRQYVFKLRK